MKPSKIYLEAAERIFYGRSHCACYAIAGVADSEGVIFSGRGFSDVFEPEANFSPFWYGDITPRNQLARQLALLFMAEIAKENE